MSTPAQILANRKNALKSTGPVTDAGKTAVSQNALKHGFCSSSFLAHGEDLEAFTALEDALIEEHQPATPTEMLLVRDMAKFHWAMERATVYQLQAIAFHGIKSIPTFDLGVMIRYQTTNDRAFHKALATLTKLRKERPNTEIGSVPQEPAETAFPAAPEAALARRKAFIEEITRPQTANARREDAKLDRFAAGVPLHPAA